MQRVRSKKGIILNIIIIALFFILVMSIMPLISRASLNGRGYVYDEYSLYSHIDNISCQEMVERVYYNEVMDAPLKGDMEELYAVAHYYENAMLYNAHKTAGNTQEAGRREERMKEYEKKLSEYSYMTEKVWKFLEEKSGR